jgi:hypothetical protein
VLAGENTNLWREFQDEEDMQELLAETSGKNILFQFLKSLGPPDPAFKRIQHAVSVGVSKVAGGLRRGLFMARLAGQPSNPPPDEVELSRHSLADVPGAQGYDLGSSVALLSNHQEEVRGVETSLTGQRAASRGDSRAGLTEHSGRSPKAGASSQSPFHSAIGVRFPVEIKRVLEDDPQTRAHEGEVLELLMDAELSSRPVTRSAPQPPSVVVGRGAAPSHTPEAVSNSASGSAKYSSLRKGGAWLI